MTVLQDIVRLAMPGWVPTPHDGTGGLRHSFAGWRGGESGRAPPGIAGGKLLPAPGPRRYSFRMQGANGDAARYGRLPRKSYLSGRPEGAAQACTRLCSCICRQVSDAGYWWGKRRAGYVAVFLPKIPSAFLLRWYIASACWRVVAYTKATGAGNMAAVQVNGITKVAASLAARDRKIWPVA